MIRVFLVCALAFSSITAAPQFVTFKDGKVGVNFAGYTAEAGLGGLLTGNAAHGGLSASAGTPFGQRAAAGIGGLVNGDAAGRAYAGAQATDSIGASAVLGGNTGPQQGGLIGAEAHSNGKSVTKTISNDANRNAQIPNSSPDLIVRTDIAKDNGIQKIKTVKKYTGIVENPIEIGVQKSLSASAEQRSDVILIPIVKSHHRHGLRRYKHVHPHILYTPLPIQKYNTQKEQDNTVKTTYKTLNRISDQPLLDSSATIPQGQNGYQTVDKNVQIGPGALNQFLNIPIGILESIRNNLQPIGVRKQVSYTSAV